MLWFKEFCHNSMSILITLVILHSSDSHCMVLQLSCRHKKEKLFHVGVFEVWAVGFGWLGGRGWFVLGFVWCFFFMFQGQKLNNF